MKILLVSPVPTHRPHAGNRARVLALAESMRNMGHSPYFVWLREGSYAAGRIDLADMRRFWGDQFAIVSFSLGANRNKRREEMLNDSFHPDLWYDGSVTPKLQSILARTRCDVMWIEYAYLSKAFELAPPKMVKVLDTVDRFSGRNDRLKKAGVISKHLVPSFANDQEELVALERADFVVAIQDREAAEFRKLTRNRVVTVGHRVEISRMQEPKLQRPTIAFLASESYIGAANLLRFLRCVYPKVVSVLPDIEVIVGGRVSRLLGALPRGVCAVGETTSVAKLFSRAHMAINTDFCATGISIKNLSTLACGVPLVTSPNGARGIQEGAGRAFLLADSDEMFATSILDVLTNPEMRRQLADGARRYASDYSALQDERLRGLFEMLMSCRVSRIGGP